MVVVNDIKSGLVIDNKPKVTILEGENLPSLPPWLPKLVIF